MPERRVSRNGSLLAVGRSSGQVRQPTVFYLVGNLPSRHQPRPAFQHTEIGYGASMVGQS